MRTHRIESLTDGIFAISMTLLVLGIDLPQKGKILGQTTLYHFLVDRSWEICVYGLSFFLLATFWIAHHRHFHYIERVDVPFLWLNIVTLMFVALLPFSTTVVGDFPDEQVAQLLFSAHVFVLGALMTISWKYASGGRRLVDPAIDAKEIGVRSRRTLAVPVVALIAIGLTFLYPERALSAYLLLPVAMTVLSRRTKGKSESG